MALTDKVGILRRNAKLVATEGISDQFMRPSAVVTCCPFFKPSGSARFGQGLALDSSVFWKFRDWRRAPSHAPSNRPAPKKSLGFP